MDLDAHGRLVSTFSISIFFILGDYGELGMRRARWPWQLSALSASVNSQVKE